MKGLKDMEKGTLLEIGTIETKTREYGQYGFVHYAKSQADAERHSAVRIGTAERAAIQQH